MSTSHQDSTNTSSQGSPVPPSFTEGGPSAGLLAESNGLAALPTEETPPSEAPLVETGVVHIGSKRHKESKHGHYAEGGQQPKKQKKRVDLVKPEDDLKDAEYYFENGKPPQDHERNQPPHRPPMAHSNPITDGSAILDLRKIYPYFFKYQTYAKGRWLGRSLIEVFNTEFRDRDNEFYERAIKDGRVQINGETVDKDYIIKNSDIVAHAIHRHEPPVAHLPVKVVRKDDGVLIVDKPSSIPVHPSGRYRHNTVLHILMKEQGYMDLYRR